jgi:deoxyhypusine synthase
MIKKDNQEAIARKNLLRKSSEKEYNKNKKIKGYDFDKGFDFDNLIEGYGSTGFQASHLHRAIELIKKMREENCVIYLGYTSNMVSSGLRDIFRYLAKNKMVDVIVTTAGGVEEDFIKCVGGDFILGSFNEDGKKLRNKSINRAGNIFIPNKRYCDFEDFLIPVLNKITKDKNIFSPSELINILGKEVNNEDSIYYWTQKNNIPVFCPAITDGSIGDMLYFYSFSNPDFKIDVVEDLKKLYDLTIKAKKTGLIILGSGIVKHHILNSNMVRNGADYAVYINNSQEFDGSDAGAMPDEAVSWGKLSKKENSVKVFGDASIIFPLVVASAFKDKGKSKDNKFKE